MVILGIVLVLAGAGLLVAEAHLPTYGLLGLAGVVALVAGGAIAVDGSGGGGALVLTVPVAPAILSVPADGSGGGVALVLTVAVVLALIAGLALVTAVRGVARVARRRARTGPEAL